MGIDVLDGPSNTVGMMVIEMMKAARSRILGMFYALAIARVEEAFRAGLIDDEEYLAGRRRILSAARRRRIW